ncbi:hypothetical protein KQX54_013541 [Cotesia glomerata]|uniref:Uncharacterized protein n=1 Tax=Cotesia glomerata TaxID=32391 RepID=A0AAV7I914_COTGL|nr:hypothetical protein KQX54_013541 [Cotesia glomerata]
MDAYRPGAIKSVAMDSWNSYTLITTGKHESREEKKETKARNAAIEELWIKVEGFRSLNEPGRSKRLLKSIDEMPEIQSLKKFEEDKIRELINNVTENTELEVSYHSLGLIRMKNNDGDNMVEPLRFFRRRCLATGEKILFRVDYVE